MESKEKNYSLHSGERQVGASLSEIRYDHLVRYELASSLIEGEGVTRGLAYDVFCGNGYGVYFLSQELPGLHIVGIDGSEAAISMANAHYRMQNNLFSYRLYPFTLPKKVSDFVTCFESLEHVEDDGGLLMQVLESLNDRGTAFVSVPNEAVHSLKKNPHEFHFRHYLHDQFMSMVPTNFEVTHWYGQNVYEFAADGICTFRLLEKEQMVPMPNQQGQVNIYVIRRKESSSKLSKILSRVNALLR